MKKKLTLLVLLVLCVLALVGCKKTKTLHCDGCGKEVQVDANSNLTEDSIILCKDCQAILYS